MGVTLGETFPGVKVRDRRPGSHFIHPFTSHPSTQRAGDLQQHVACECGRVRTGVGVCFLLLLTGASSSTKLQLKVSDMYSTYCTYRAYTYTPVLAGLEALAQTSLQSPALTLPNNHHYLNACGWLRSWTLRLPVYDIMAFTPSSTRICSSPIFPGASTMPANQ